MYMDIFPQDDYNDDYPDIDEDDYDDISDDYDDYPGSEEYYW